MNKNRPFEELFNYLKKNKIINLNPNWVQTFVDA